MLSYLRIRLLEILMTVKPMPGLYLPHDDDHSHPLAFTV